MKRSNKNSYVGGIVAGISAAAAAVGACVAAFKVRDDIKKNSCESNLISPCGDRYVNIVCGSTDMPRISCADITAVSGDTRCHMRVVAKGKLSSPTTVWESNDTFTVTFCDGCGKMQSVTVRFENERIKMYEEKCTFG